MLSKVIRMLGCLVVLAAPAVTQEPGVEDAAQEAQATGEAGSSPAEGRVPQFGGPSSVGGELNEDQAGRELLDWRERMAEAGFSFGVNTSALYQGVSGGSGADEAAGGIFQLPISWTLQRGESSTGTLVVKSEWRGRLGTDVAPQDLGFAAGAVAIPGTQFSDLGWAVTNAYWQQRLNGGRVAFSVGRVDATDYLDVYGLINPQTSFQNLVFLTNPSIASPNPGLGAGFGAMLGESAYLVAGFADANGVATRSGFDAFDFGELFKHVEIGWTPSQERIYFDNAHVTLWHVDERPEAGVPEGSGVALSFARFLGDRLMPFVRAGFSDGGGGALQESTVAAGLGWYRPESRDLLGFGVAWGEPSEESFGPGLDDQWTAELFYRWQVLPVFALTGDLQLIENPALDPGEDRIVIFGVRGRLSF